MKKRITSLALALSFVFASVMTAYAAKGVVRETQLGKNKDGQPVNSVVSAYPTSISYKDLKQLEKVVGDFNHMKSSATVKPEDPRKAAVINAKDISGNGSKWIVRVQVGNPVNLESGNECNADYVVSLLEYVRNPKTQELVSLGFQTDSSDAATIKNGSAVYGPCWYYFGLFTDEEIVSQQGLPVSKSSPLGFALAERINRWPDWKILAYDDNDPRTDKERELGVPARGFLGTTFRGETFHGSYLEPNSINFLAEHMN